jgi:hypothetical protein
MEGGSGKAGEEDAGDGGGGEEKGGFWRQEEGEADEGEGVEGEALGRGGLGLDEGEDAVRLGLEVGVEAAADAQAAQKAEQAGLEEDEGGRDPADEGQQGLALQEMEDDGRAKRAGQDHGAGLGDIETPPGEGT